ncbi:hypothetical protein ABPG77_007680 [Micractinium sp. CCAP 211/92]
MATAFTLCSGPIAGACSLGKGRVLVSVQGDGVSCYDVSGQKPVASWALGGADQEFSSGAVYDYDTNLLFAPLRQRGTSGGKSGSVLEWSADDTVGTITGLARPMHLPPLHAVFPLSGAPEGEEAQAAAAAAEEAEAAAIDGSGAARAGAVAVFASGGAALCGCGEVVAEVEEACGQHTVAAAFQPAPFQAAGEGTATSQQQARRQGTLVLVHSDPRSGAVAASAYHVAGDQFEVVVPAAELTAPSAGARAVGATATPERTAVLWSDGTVAVYAVPGDKQPLGTIPGQPSGPGVPLAKRRLAGFRLPAGKQHKGSGGKKRGAGGEPDASPAGVSLAAIRDKQVAVVGWATNAEGATVLRLVVLETAAACVQLAQDWTAADVGLAVLDPSKPVQACHLGGSSNQLAISVGTAVLIATLTELKPPTLANLLGALALDRVALSGASSSGGDGGSGLDVLKQPSAAAAGRLLGSTAAVNPAALAASRVLHADEIEALSAPFGGAARPMQLRLKLEDPEEPGDWLVPAKEIDWGPVDAKAVAQLEQAERRVWQEVTQPAAAALASDAALQEALAPLLKLRQSSGLALSPRLVSRLIMLAAENQHWESVAALVAAQPPSLLGEVPGLAAAAADAGQFELLEQLLDCCCDVPAIEVTALLRVLLSPASSSQARECQEARHSAACAAADAAAQAAAAAGAQQGAQLPAAAKQQQHDEKKQQGARSGGRRRRRSSGGADAAESDGEEAAAAAAAAAATDPEPSGEHEQHGADGPALPWLQAAGARKAAVAACCRAAVHGFGPADCCLHALVARSYRPAELVAALRPLGAVLALRLLRYLATLLRNLMSLVGAQDAGWEPPLALPAGAPPLPRLPQALAWANATLDASLIPLSMQPEAGPLLQELASLVEAQVADTKPLLRLVGMVEHAVQQRPLPQSAGATADYSIQWLDLRVAPPEVQQQQQQQRQQQAAVAMQQ